MLLDVIIETHAWASARPKHEAAMESQKLEEQISHIIATEREQGMSSPAPSSSSSFFRVRFVGMPHSVMASLFSDIMSTPIIFLSYVFGLWIFPCLSLLRWNYHRTNSGETRRVCATYEDGFGSAYWVTVLTSWNSGWVLRVNIRIATIYI
jgi:hypothetical protein